MPWEHFWPIFITLLGAGLLILAAELGYRAARKVVRWRRRKAEARPRWAWLPLFWRQAEQFVEALYRPVQLLAALLGAQLFAAPISNDDLDVIEAGLWDGIYLALIWIGAVSLLWVIALVGGLGALGSDLGRRFRSQLETVTRVLSVLVFLAIIVIILVELDHAYALGSTVLAGAGLVGVVAGLAAQRFLANMFAGIAIGFGDKLNIGDMVELEGESGTVTARTLTYVALKLSEQRTLVVPTSQFLDKAHTDWKLTRKQVVGWVPLQVDWGVSIPDLLKALRKGYQSLKYGDGKDLKVEVVGVSESAVQVRAMVQASPDDLWDVQCNICQYLVDWINGNETPRPRLRVETNE